MSSPDGYWSEHPGILSRLMCECCSNVCDCGCVEDCPAPSCREAIAYYVSTSDGAE